MENVAWQPREPATFSFTAGPQRCEGRRAGPRASPGQPGGCVGRAGGHARDRPPGCPGRSPCSLGPSFVTLSQTAESGEGSYLPCTGVLLSPPSAAEKNEAGPRPHPTREGVMLVYSDLPGLHQGAVREVSLSKYLLGGCTHTHTHTKHAHTLICASHEHTHTKHARPCPWAHTHASHVHTHQTCSPVHMCTYTSTRQMCAYTHMHTYACVHLHVSITLTHTRVCTDMHMYTHQTHTCTHTCTYITHMSPYTHAHVHYTHQTHTCAHTHSYTRAPHTRVHGYTTRTCIHTCTYITHACACTHATNI